MKPSTANVLLLGAGGSAGANILDALRCSDHQYQVVGVDISPVRLHLSRADERYVIKKATDAGYFECIDHIVRTRGVDVIHPQPDPDVLAIGRVREELAAKTLLPSQDALLTARDKVFFAQAMAVARIPVPESAGFETEEDVLRVTEDCLERHDRVWIRAREGAGARASLPVRNANQALAWVSWWCSERGMRVSDFMAAEMLPGREFAYQSIWSDGHLIAGQARERVEYLYGFLTPHGQSSTPSVARTVCDERIDELAQRAILALDRVPQGAFCVDIKEAADGSPRVTEINAGRFFTTSNFFAHAGLNMPDMLMRMALGERVKPVSSSPLPPDLYWLRMVDMGYRLVPGAELDRWPGTDS